MAARKSKSESEVFDYQGRRIPERLKKLYWHGPIVTFVSIGSALFTMALSGKIAEHLQLLDWEWLLIPGLFYGCFLGLFLRFCWKRKRRLEAEAMNGLPNGWHLIYRYKLMERRFRPELVFGSAFDEILQTQGNWFRYRNVYISNFEKIRLKSESH
jgi:MFS family permease